MKIVLNYLHEWGKPFELTYLTNHVLEELDPRYGEGLFISTRYVAGTFSPGRLALNHI
jgi:hypothetical protein